MASPVIPGKKIQLLGAYCNDHGKSWNPDSGQPDVKSWKAGRDDFQAETGAPFLNGGNIFCGNSNAWLKGNIAYTMGMVNQVYPNGPYDYIPSIGCKLYQVNEKSPSTGKAYGWNDVQAYKDVAAGLWDASWTGVVDAMVAAGRPIWFQRVAYEGNAAFMQDFCGYDPTPSRVSAWCAAVRRAFSVIKTRAAQVGAYPIMGINPTSLNQNDPNVENLFLGVGPDVQNMIAFDFYNGYWGLSGSLCPPDTSGKVAGVGPTQSALSNMWNSQNGAVGFNMASALARKYKIPLTILETGSSGGDHHMLDDPFFYPWQAGAIQAHRAAGGTMIMANIWSVPAGDGNTSVQYGNQPHTLASLKGVINTFVGDAFDPTALAYGGSSSGTPPPQPTEPPPVVTPPINPAVSPTSISVVVVPASTVKGEAYQFVATAVGNPWSAVGNVQHQITLPQNNNSSSGWVTPPSASVALDTTGMIATVSGLISGMVMPHTVQFRDSVNPGVMSPLVSYPTTLAPVTPPAPLVTHPLTITYSDGSPSITLQVAAGVTASYTVLPPSRPPPGPEGPGQIMTVTFADHTLSPIVTTNAVGTTATVTTPVTVTYSDGSPDVVLAAVAGSVSVTEPPRPQQTTTVSFSDERLPPIVSMNEPGTTVAFS